MNLNFKKLIIALLIVFMSCNIFAIKKLDLLKSLLIPGWGEISQNKKSGYVLMTNEVLFWATKYYFNNESDLAFDRSIFYARKYAGISKGDYTEQYYKNMETFMSAGFDPGGFNHKILDQAQELTGNEFETYLENNTYPEEMYWNWQSKEKRSKYIESRNNYRDYDDLSKVMTGVIIANHFASVINLLIINRNNNPNYSFNVDLNCSNTPILNCSIDF